MITIAINGFGRIGRTFLRALFSNKSALQKLRVSAINIGPAESSMIAHMFAHDTLMGTFHGTVSFENNVLTIDGQEIAILSEQDPLRIDWKRYGVEWVVEASGHFTKRQEAQKHCTAGALRVLITAPAKDADAIIVPGVNQDRYNPQTDHIVSLGSCTTNALLPTLQVLHEAFGIDAGFMTTIHAYTNTQVLLDVERDDLRRSRAAALNIVPTSTGASKMVGSVIPELEGKIQAQAIRVPVAKVSLIDLSISLNRSATVQSINDTFKKASEGPLSGIMGYTDKELVSSDFSGNPHSVIIDSKLTQTSGNMGHIFGWYDNEWGYCMRLIDFLLMAAKKSES